MKNHKHLDQLLHRSGSIYYAILDNTGMFSYVNGLYDKTFGPFLPDPGAYGFSSVIVPEDIGLFVKIQQECLKMPGNIACVDLRKRRSDGDLVPTRWECSVLMDDNGIAGLQCLGKDIAGSAIAAADRSEGKKAGESLRMSIERFSILSKAVNDLIWDWDLVSGKILWSDAIRSFGFDPEDVSLDFQWWKERIHPEDRERVASGIEEQIRNGAESWQDQYRFMRADGSFRIVMDRGFVLFDESHKPYRMMGIIVDLSDRVRMQEERAQHNIARQRQITEAAILAQEKQRAEIGRELHDNINQILTTTKLYLDIAINEEGLRQELMAKSYQNISTVIEEIRTLSKSLVPPSLGDIGLKEAIYEMIENLNISRKITIRLRTVGFANADIRGNIKLVIFRIVQEQVNNIIKHSKATNAEIKLAISKENLNITVTDNGVGFDTKKKVKGIGLTNITSRAEAYNGRVEIISSPGNGCALKVSIPI